MMYRDPPLPLAGLKVGVVGNSLDDMDALRVCLDHLGPWLGETLPADTDAVTRARLGSKEGNTSDEKLPHPLQRFAEKLFHVVQDPCNHSQYVIVIRLPQCDRSRGDSPVSSAASPLRVSRLHLGLLQEGQSLPLGSTTSSPSFKNSRSLTGRAASACQ